MRCLRACPEVELTPSRTGTVPGFGAPELIGTATVSIVTPAGNLINSLTGVNCVGTTVSVSLPPCVSEPSAAQKSIVNGRRLRLCPDGDDRTSVTVS